MISTSLHMYPDLKHFDRGFNWTILMKNMKPIYETDEEKLIVKVYSLILKKKKIA